MSAQHPKSSYMLLTPRAACAALATLASLLLLGCDARPKLTSPLTTSDLAQSDVASLDTVTMDVPSSANVVEASTLGGPLAGLTGDELARFYEGQAEFQEEETTDEGLGPVFNEASCTTCHNAPVGGTNGRGETRFGRWRQPGFDPRANRGGSLLQDHAIGRVDTEHGSYTFVPEVVPREANVVATRITTPLFGLGLVEAVPDEALLALARFQARN